MAAGKENFSRSPIEPVEIKLDDVSISCSTRSLRTGDRHIHAILDNVAHIRNDECLPCWRLKTSTPRSPNYQLQAPTVLCERRNAWRAPQRLYCYRRLLSGGGALMPSS